jgi:[ribosomal protein S5]-alanine N-acetyltransferase
MTTLNLLETDRLMLTGWTTNQVGDLLRLHGNPNVSRYLTLTGEPWTEAEARGAVEHWIALFSTRRFGKMRLIRKPDGAFIGRAGFGVYEPTGEPELGFEKRIERTRHVCAGRPRTELYTGCGKAGCVSVCPEPYHPGT